MSNKPYLTIHNNYLPLALYAVPVLEVCKARGVNVNKLLWGTGIAKADIVSGINVSPQQIIKLLGNAKSLTPGYDSAFQIGRVFAQSQQSLIKQALLHSRNFADCLRTLTLFSATCSPFVGAYFIKEDQHGYWLLNPKYALGKLEPFVLEIFCTALVSLSQQILGHRVKFHFGFQWSRPRYIQEYEENLGYRIHFKQPINMIAIELSLLQGANGQRNDLIKWHAIHQAKTSSYKQRTLLEVLRGHIHANINVTLPELAKILDISPATLKRKLKDAGLSFTQLHDEVRKHHAIHYLLLKGLTNEQSAYALAISDPTNFRRAIKKWTGQTPSQLKQSSPILPILPIGLNNSS